MALRKLEKFAIGAFLLDTIVTLQGVNDSYSNEGNPVVQWIFTQGPLALLIAWAVWIFIIIKMYRGLDKPFNNIFIWVIIVSHGLAAATWLVPEWSSLLWSGSNNNFITLSLYQIYFGVVLSIWYILCKKK